MIFILGLPCAGISTLCKEAGKIPKTKIIDVDSFLEERRCGRCRFATRDSETMLLSTGVLPDTELDSLSVMPDIRSFVLHGGKNVIIGGIPQFSNHDRLFRFLPRLEQACRPVVVDLLISREVSTERSAHRLGNGATEFEKWKDLRQRNRMIHLQNRVGRSVDYFCSHQVPILVLDASRPPEDIFSEFLSRAFSV